MSRRRRVFSGILTSGLQQVVQIFQQLYIAPLLLTTAGQAILGSYGFIMQIFGYGVLFDFGCGTAINRYLSRSYSESKGNKAFLELIMNGSICLYITNILIASFLLVVYAKLDIFLSIYEESYADCRACLILMITWVLIRSPFHVYIFALPAMQKNALVNIITTFFSLLKLILSLVSLFLGFRLQGLVFSFILAEFLKYIFITYSFYRCASDSRRNLGDLLDFSLIRRIFRFGFSYSGVNLSAIFLLGSDNIIVLSILGPVSASIYYSTKVFSSFLIAFVSKLIDNVIPGLNQLVGEGNLANTRKTYLLFIKYTYVIACISFFAVQYLTRPFVELWLGSGQFAGHLSSISFGFMVFVQLLSHCHSTMYLAVGYKINRWSILAVVFSSSGALLAFLTTPIYGLPACIISLSCANLLLTIFQIRNLHVNLQISLTRYLSYVLPPLCIACLVYSSGYLMYSSSQIQQNIFIVVIFFLLLCIIYIFLLTVSGYLRSEFVSIRDRFSNYIHINQ